MPALSSECRTASECVRRAKDQFPEDPEPDKRIHWRISQQMGLAVRLALSLLDADPGKRWGVGELRDSVYGSPAWDVADSAPISLGLRKADDEGLIEICRDGSVYLP